MYAICVKKKAQALNQKKNEQNLGRKIIKVQQKFCTSTAKVQITLVAKISRTKNNFIAFRQSSILF